MLCGLRKKGNENKALNYRSLSCFLVLSKNRFKGGGRGATPLFVIPRNTLKYDSKTSHLDLVKR